MAHTANEPAYCTRLARLEQPSAARLANHNLPAYSRTNRFVGRIAPGEIMVDPSDKQLGWYILHAREVHSGLRYLTGWMWLCVFMAITQWPVTSWLTLSVLLICAFLLQTLRVRYKGRGQVLVSEHPTLKELEAARLKYADLRRRSRVSGYIHALLGAPAAGFVLAVISVGLVGPGVDQEIRPLAGMAIAVLASLAFSFVLIVLTAPAAKRYEQSCERRQMAYQLRHMELELSRPSVDT
jgi:membrane protein implicated in regulation of membrane protease activity